MKTYVILSIPRSGSSMVSGLLRIFGINMGRDNMDPLTHEDKDFVIKNNQQVRELVKKRNKCEEDWGWKDPWIGLIINQITDALVNPRYIYISRDLVAALESDLKHNPELGNRKDGRQYIWNRNKCLLDNIHKHMLHTTRPVLRLSYERSLKYPKETVEKLEKFTGVKLDRATKEKAIKFIKPGYRKVGGLFK